MSDVGIRLLTTRTPTPMMDASLQFAYGLILRGFVHILHLDRTRPRLAATILGLCEAVLVHGDVRAPRRSGRAAYDAWEVDAYVGIVARLALDLVTDGPGKAAIVGMWAVLGVVILDLLFRASASSSSSHDYDDDDSSTIISSIRGRRSSRRHSPVRRSSTRERHGLAPRGSQRTEVRGPPSGRTRPDISHWTASLPAAAVSMSRASSGSQHHDPHYDQHARESTVEWQPRTPPATVMATPSTTIRNGISGTEVSVMHLTAEDTETKSTITSETGSAYESAAPSGPSLDQVHAAIANVPVKSGLGSTYESALAPASTVRMLRPRHAIPTPEPSDFSTLSSLQSRRRPAPTNTNTTDSPVDGRTHSTTSRRGRMDDDRSELTQDRYPRVTNNRRGSRSRSPPTRALLDPALPAASSVPNPASPPRKRTPSPDSSLAPRPSAARSHPPESVASSDLGSEPALVSKSLSRRPSRASRSHFAPSIPEESENHDSASEVSNGKGKAVSRKSSKSRVGDTVIEETKSTISRKTSRSLAGASIPEETQPIQLDAPIKSEQMDAKKPSLSRKTSRSSRIAERTIDSIDAPALSSSPPQTQTQPEDAPNRPSLSRKNSHKSTTNAPPNELTNDDLPAPLARRPSRVLSPSPPPLDPLVPVPESPAPPSSSSVVVTADESLPPNTNARSTRSPSPSMESAAPFDTMRRASGSVRPGVSSRMTSSRSNISKLTEAYIPPTPPAVSSDAPTPTAAAPSTGMVSYPIVAPSPSASPAPAESVSEAALVTAEEETPVPSVKSASPAPIARALSPPVPIVSPLPPLQTTAKEDKDNAKSVKAKSSVQKLPRSETEKGKEKEIEKREEDEPIAASAREHALEKRPEAQRTKSSKSVKSDVSKRTKASAATAQPSTPAPPASGRSNLASRLAGASAAAAPSSKSQSKPKSRPKRRSGGLSSDEEDAGSESGSGSDAIDSGLEDFSLDSPSVGSSGSRSDDSNLEPAPSFGNAGAGLLAQSKSKGPSTTVSSPSGKAGKSKKAGTEAATPTQDNRSVPQDYFSLIKAETEADRSDPVGAGRGSSRRLAEGRAEDVSGVEERREAKGKGKEKDSKAGKKDKDKGKNSDKEVTSSDAERKVPASASLRTVAQRALSGQPKKSSTTLAQVAAAKRGSPLGRAITAPARMRQRPKSTASDATTVSSVLTAPHDRTAVLARAEALRSEANDEEAKGREADADRTKADFEGRFMDALRAKVRRVEHRERSARLHRRAERRYLHAHNMTQDRSQHVIDIHGLKVTEARSHVEKALRDAIVAGAPRLRVITGRGNHSVGNVPVLKTRIIEAMAEYHIPTRVHPTNPGELWIELAPGAVGTPS